MGKYLDLAIAALISAIVGGFGELFFEYLKGKLKDKTLQEIIKDIWLRTLIYAGIGLIIGIMGWMLISRWYQKTFFTFDQSSESWKPLMNPNDAAMATGWEPRSEALRAEFNFAQTDQNNPDQRANFYYDNFNDTWSGYKTFTLDVTNPNSEHLEITFSVDVNGCFHEFGLYRNLSPGESTTVSFDFTKPRFKTCKFPSEFDQPLDSKEIISRMYLIVGTNESPANFGGNILIDDIRLQKNTLLYRLALATLVFVVIYILASLEHQYRQRFGPSKKGELDAKPIS